MKIKSSNKHHYRTEISYAVDPDIAEKHLVSNAFYDGLDINFTFLKHLEELRFIA